MAVLPVYIMNERTKERLPDHRLGRVLWERANEAMTAFDYQRLMLCNELLRGNAYAWIYRDPRTGWPRELIPLPPDYMTIHVDLDGHVWYFSPTPPPATSPCSGRRRSCTTKRTARTALRGSASCGGVADALHRTGRTAV